MDSPPVTRYGIARLIDQEPDLFVCAEADTVPRALDTISAMKPQVVLTDLRIPG